MNPARKLRDALGWSQTTFAQAIGRSYQTIRNWEAGHRIPPESLEKMKSIASEHGLADIAMELSSEEWQVQRVFHPGETLISQAPAEARARGRERGAERREQAHQWIDEIFDSGDTAAIAAVSRTLDALARMARLEQKRSGRVRTKK
ncbi:MAG: helix-turn-helix transcriptional regulator [Terriglobia bacterium]